MGQDRKKDKIMCRWGNMPMCQCANISICQWDTVLYVLGVLLLGFSIIGGLGVVCLTFPELPVAEMSGQIHYFSIACIIFGVCGIISYSLFVFSPSAKSMNFDVWVTWILIGLAGIQCIWGLRQIYGYAHSNHTLFSLTGSFFNPGPYSGYLAMILPISLHEFLRLNKILIRNIPEKIGYYLSGFVLLLIVCLLPAGMSRSAWLAAILSCLFVVSFHYSWFNKMKILWLRHKKKVISMVLTGCAVSMLGLFFVFTIKRDSANGRLFMWKISTIAITEKPLTGHGINTFPAVYGDTQENYFSTGNYTEREELIAGSPEYAFNEYLQIALEWGIPVLVFLLAGIVYCFYIGFKKHRIGGVCGAILSLMVFAFSSYPFQLPVFVITFVFLLAACVFGENRFWLGAFAIVIGVAGLYLKKTDVYDECCKWKTSRMLYQVGAYDAAIKEYTALYPALKKRPAFLFEYGHAYHKTGDYARSNEIMLEASKRSNDPMIFNIIGKNYQSLQEYYKAEYYFLRSVNRLPGRIYPYYLLVKLYAEPDFFNKEKLDKMAVIVLNKEPKVQSTAIRQMRDEVRKICAQNN